MWILTALSRQPFARPLLIFVATLGAVYPLLAYLLADNPVAMPLIYAIIAALTAIAWPPRHALIRGLIAAVLSYFLAVYVLDYAWLFSVAFTLLIGYVLFPESFRFWKWLAVTVLFFISLWAVSVWQQIFYVTSLVPPFLLPSIPGALWGFSLFCAFLVYRLQKDPVREAFDHYNWKPDTEARNLALQVLQTYEHIDNQTSQQELRNLSENTMHLCNRLQEIYGELQRMNPDELEEELRKIQERMDSTNDAVAKKQYEQALGNKEKQKEHYDHLRTQCERIHAQILNYLSALENIRLAYANRHFKGNGENRDLVELFLNLANAQAETAAENAEAYEKLCAS